MISRPPIGVTAAVPNHAGDRPATYRLDIGGRLDDHWSDWLGGATLVRNEDRTTTLTATVADQAQLHGILTGIRDIGADLLSLRKVDDATTRPVLDRVLRTERLVLRPATPEDADATWAYRRVVTVNEWLTGTPDDRRAYRKVFTEPARLTTTVIVERAPEQVSTRGRTVIGDVMLRREDAWAQAEVTERARGAQAELGWVLDPTHTGRGYATEAVRELLRYCFEDLRVHRVVASCFLDNVTSWRLMERVGMRREDHAVRESLHRSGRWLDTVAYAILDDEWGLSDSPS